MNLDVRRLPRRLLMGLVQAYRLLLRPWVGNVCRFEPTCSSYALRALERHGAVRGTALTGWRLLRCQPWCQGGCDPVPESFRNPAAGLFSRLVPPVSPVRPARASAPDPKPQTDT